MQWGVGGAQRSGERMPDICANFCQKKGAKTDKEEAPSEHAGEILAIYRSRLFYPSKQSHSAHTNEVNSPAPSLDGPKRETYHF